jgi:DNA invertase Pin-like site-specific DNA recombinase
MARYAYMLLDETEKDVSRQAMQLDSIGGFERIYVDRPPLGQEKREQRQRLLAALQAGDVIYVASADRFCRQTREFLEIYAQIAAIGAELVLLQENLDTRSPAGRQSLRLLTAFARLDFFYQSERKREGIAAAREIGRRIGRPPVAIPADFREICQRWSLGQLTGHEAAREAGLRSTSFYKKAAEFGFRAPPRQARQPDQQEP